MTARDVLREATRDVHERLHHVPAFAALAAGAITEPDYARLLSRLYGFHAPMEQALAEALDPAPFAGAIGTWRRAHLLAEDLAALGWDSGALTSLARVTPPDGLTPAAGMGCLYVVEGSTLGGRQLARQLDPALPKRFLSAGAQPGRMTWAAFCKILDCAGAEPACLAQMTEAAIVTFARFEGWFGSP